MPGSLQAGAYVQFQVVGQGGIPLNDAKITPYEEHGNEIPHFFPQIDQGLDDRLLFGLAEAGTVYAAIESMSGAGTGEYALQVVGIGFYYEGNYGNNNYTFDPTSQTDLVRTFAGNDDISTEGGDDIIYAGDGDDDVNAGNGDDLIFGGRGDDNLRSGNGNDTIHGGAGDDRLSNSSGNTLLFGELGNDTLVGGDPVSSETLVGGQGNDFLRGQGGDDQLRGGLGEDSVTYHGEAAITLSLTDQNLNAGAAAGDVLTSIDALRGSVFADAITGNGFRNIPRGNDGDDTLSGGGGTDLLIGGQGDDLLIGGTGTDRLTGSVGVDTFEFRAGDGDDFVLDFNASADILRLSGDLSGVTVSNDGTDTLIEYDDGGQSVTLTSVLLAQGEITFDFV